jgi:hypothetical protein
MNMMHPKLRQAQRRSVRGQSALLATVAALTLVAGGRAAAATVLSAGWESSCGASSCFNAKGTYAITFSGAAFSGPVDISKLVLARSFFGNLDSHFFSLSFQMGGHQVGTWGNWNMSSVGGDELSFSGSDLIWNPADGDLVLVVDLVGANGEKLLSDGAGGWYDPYAGGGGGGGGGGGQSSFTEVIFNTPTPDNGSPPPNGGPGGTLTPPGSSQGPVTATGSVPEPATWAIMVGGFGLAGAALRRRRARTAIAAA